MTIRKSHKAPVTFTKMATIPHTDVNGADSLNEDLERFTGDGYQTIHQDLRVTKEETRHS